MGKKTAIKEKISKEQKEKEQSRTTLLGLHPRMAKIRKTLKSKSNKHFGDKVVAIIAFAAQETMQKFIDETIANTKDTEQVSTLSVAKALKKTDTPFAGFLPTRVAGVFVSSEDINK